VDGPLWNDLALSITDNSPWLEEPAAVAGSVDLLVTSSLLVGEMSISEGSSGGGVNSTDMFLAYGCAGRRRGRFKPALAPRTDVAALVSKTCCARLAEDEILADSDVDRVISAALPTNMNSPASIRNGDETDDADHTGLNA
jgi:hypothetical protein